MVDTKARLRLPKHKASALCLLVALCMGVLGLVAPVWGEDMILTVDRQDDPDPITASACTEAPDDCSLRGAVVAANATAEAETINVPAGNYTLTIAGPFDDASATGDLDASNVTIKGGGARQTKVVGGSDFDDRILNTFGNVMVTGLTITGGRSPKPYSYGGGVYSYGDVTLNKVAITDNISPFRGGGFFSYGGPGTTVNITNSTISGNFAGDAGGGISRSGMGTAIVANTTISDNHTHGQGGGIFVTANGWLTILNSTIASNTSWAVGGGGIFASQLNSLVEVKNTVVSSNTPDNCRSKQDAGKGIISHGHNISSDRTCHFTQPTDQPNTRPRLGTLSNNGGPTDTRALLEGSPAIDRGANTGCPATDQRGKERPKDGNGDGRARCDIGAFEKQRP